MKKQLSPKVIFFIVLLVTFLLCGIILLCLVMLLESMFAFLPLPFCLWTYVSFFYPKDVQKHVGLLFLSTASRFLCSVCSLLIPALIWKFVPSYSTISYYWLLMPFGAIMLTYLFTIVNNIVEKKKEDENA